MCGGGEVGLLLCQLPEDPLDVRVPLSLTGVCTLLPYFQVPGKSFKHPAETALWEAPS